MIAAGWAVEDEPAEKFATAFYASLLGGGRFIEAVGFARAAAWNANRDGNTWAAYQAYGDPNWIYRRGAAEVLTVALSLVLAANLLGGYLVGVAIAVFQSMPQIDPVWRLLLITGFLGGLTTFSTFSAEVVTHLIDERYALAAGIVLAHVAGSLLLTVAGIKTAMFFIASCAGRERARGHFCQEWTA